MGASSRSWPECRGTGFKRGPESWRDKLSKLTIKKSFFASILQIQFFSKLLHPKNGVGGKNGNFSFLRVSEWKVFIIAMNKWWIKW